jgi:hypothetical protein
MYFKTLRLVRMRRRKFASALFLKNLNPVQGFGYYRISITKFYNLIYCMSIALIGKLKFYMKCTLLFSQSTDFRSAVFHSVCISTKG